jgi:hypothetical protein
VQILYEGKMRLGIVLTKFVVLSVLSSALLAGKVEVIDLPDERNTIQLSPTNPLFKNSLDNLIDFAKKDRRPLSFERIGSVTIEEAKTHFLDYASEKLGNDQVALSRLFTSDFFGPEKMETITTPEQIANNDGYLFGHIANMLTDGSPGREKTMEKAKERWSLAAQFLSAEEVARAFTNRPSYGKRFKYEDIIKNENVFNSKYFGVPEDENERKSHFLTNSIGFLTPEFIMGIYQGAQKIMKMTQPGDRIVIFGNSPVFVGRALNHLLSKDESHENYRHLINFPFSGAPNGEREGSIKKLKDIVTPERHKHLKERMRSVGLHVENGDLLKGVTYFVDLVASGSGIAYVAEDLLRDFKIASKEYPELHVITMNEIDISNEAEDSRNASIADKSAKDGESLWFSFPSKENTHFKIQAAVAFVPGHARLDMLPSSDWRIFPEYNAMYWQPCFDELLTAELPRHKKMILEYFDTHIQKLMSEGKNTL